MSTDDRQLRDAAIDLVLQHATAHPRAGLPLAQVSAVFGDRRELLLALQMRWTRALWTRIEDLTARMRRRGVPVLRSPVASVAHRAWADCALANPVLRRLLDDYADELGAVAARADERRADPRCA